MSAPSTTRAYALPAFTLVFHVRVPTPPGAPAPPSPSLHPPDEASIGEYLGTDESDREYFTRGGHVYRTSPDEGGPDQRRAPCPRGRLAGYNRLSRRHPRSIAA